MGLVEDLEATWLKAARGVVHTHKTMSLGNTIAAAKNDPVWAASRLHKERTLLAVALDELEHRNLALEKSSTALDEAVRNAKTLRKELRVWFETVRDLTSAFRAVPEDLLASYEAGLGDD